MSAILLQNVTFGYPGAAQNIFENFSAVLDSDWKLALTGRNGRGKTTLLRLLCGEYEYKGKISVGAARRAFRPVRRPARHRVMAFKGGAE